MKKSPLMFVLSLSATFLQVGTFFYLWNWFLVPLGMQSISFLHAWGLICLINVPIIGLYSLSIKKLDDELNPAFHYFFTILICVAYMFIGYICHLYL
jgi:hypothetical protein